MQFELKCGGITIKSGYPSQITNPQSLRPDQPPEFVTEAGKRPCERQLSAAFPEPPIYYANHGTSVGPVLENRLISGAAAKSIKRILQLA